MSSHRIVSAVIIAIGLIVAAMAFAVVTAIMQATDSAMALRVAYVEDQIKQIELEAEQQETRLFALERELEVSRDEIASLAARGPGANTTQSAPVNAEPTATLIFDPNVFDAGEDANSAVFTEEMKLTRSAFNSGISQPRNSVMLEVLGRPRNSLSQDCQSVTQPRLRSLLETRTIGPLRVTMIRPALESLERIMARLAEEEPQIYAGLGTAGALCARYVRGSSSSISNHSWGTAIDIKIDSRLDDFADGNTQLGLVILAEYFNDEGWYWGAGYRREDSMHFEVGIETLRRWESEGLLR